MKKLVKSDIIYILIYIFVCLITLNYLYHYTFTTSEMYQGIAKANISSLSVGAFALTFLLLLGIFLFSLHLKQGDYHLLLLVIAFGLQSVIQFAVAQGEIFLPDALYQILSNKIIYYIPSQALLLYLLLKQDKEFLTYFANFIFIILGTFVILYGVSYISNGKLAVIVNSYVERLFSYGDYPSIIHVLTVVLLYTCAGITLLCFIKGFTHKQAYYSVLELKHHESIQNFANIQNEMLQSSKINSKLNELLDEMQNDLNAGHYSHLQSLVQAMQDYAMKEISPHYTSSCTLNNLLLTYRYQANLHHTEFHVSVHIPTDLTIPELDISCFLINMLDNAIESNLFIEPTASRYINLSITCQNDFFTIKCENPYAIEPVLDYQGNLKSTKKNNSRDALGVQLMNSIAKQYNSFVSIQYKEHVFSLQAAFPISEFPR